MLTVRWSRANKFKSAGMFKTTERSTKRFRSPFPTHVTATGLGLLLLLFLVLLRTCSESEAPAGRTSENERPPEAPTKKAFADGPLMVPKRPIPERFPKDTSKPGVREVEASGAIDMTTFSAGHDLVYVNDDRIYWESDNDGNDVECDHTFNRALVEPFKRLHNLLLQRHPSAILEVQEAYRPTGIHVRRSLHREGRAIDLTCDQIPLEELAKLCWAAGFNWVLYEHSKGTGPHIHASVRRLPLKQVATTSEKAPRGDSRKP